MIRPFVFKRINDRMFQQTTAGEVSLYHITQLYRKVCMCLCRTEYQYPLALYPLPDPTVRQTTTSDFLDRQRIMVSQINDYIYYYSLWFLRHNFLSDWWLGRPRNAIDIVLMLIVLHNTGPMDRRNVILECAQVIGKIKGNNWLYLVIYDLNILYCIYISIYFT